MGIPFSRSKAMFGLMAAAMGLAAHLQGAAMANIGPYESRGKGEGLRANKRSRHRVAMDKRSRHRVAMDKRAACKARNKRRAK
jgi:hypothetical protein